MSKKKVEKKALPSPLVIGSIIIGSVVFLVSLLTITKIITWFKNGVMLSNKTEFAVVLQEGEVEKLNNFKRLEHVDLSGSADFDAIEAWAKEHPNVDVDYIVELPEDAIFSESSNEIDFTKLNRRIALESIESVQHYLKASKIRIDCDNWSVEDVKSFCEKSTRLNVIGTRHLNGEPVDEYLRLREIAPNLTYLGKVSLDGVAISITDHSPVLDGVLTEKGFAELETLLEVSDVIDAIDFGLEEDGHTILEKVYNFMLEHPDILVDYKFTAFNRIHGIHASVLDFNHTKMTDQGEEVRQIIPYMHNLELLDMDWCGVDNEHMEAIRDDFPEIKVVWRIWIGKIYSVRTDTQKLFLSAFGGDVLSDKDVVALKYCTETKYLDVGHNEPLTTCDFVSYMPNLEVAILSITAISDLSPLLNCKKLEYFEIFRSNVKNLDGLKECKELKHINVARNPYLADITGVYELENIERFWIGNASSTRVPRAQVAKFKELHPGIEVNDSVYHAHQYGWRDDSPRYQLLIEQFGYNLDGGDSDYSVYWHDSQYWPHKTVYTDEQLGLSN